MRSKEQRFRDVEEIKANATAERKALISEQFQRAFKNGQIAGTDANRTETNNLKDTSLNLIKFL